MSLFFILYFQNWKYKLEVNVNGSAVFCENQPYVSSRAEPHLYPLSFILYLNLGLIIRQNKNCQAPSLYLYLYYNIFVK